MSDHRTIMSMADEIMGGALTDPSVAKSGPLILESQEEELPEISDEQHNVIMSHVLDENLKDTAKKIVKKAKGYGKKIKKALTWTDAHRDKAGMPRRGERYKGPREMQKKKLHPKALKFGKDTQVATKNFTRTRSAASDMYRKDEQKEHKMENFTQDQIEILRKAKEIVSETTGTGSIGVNMAGKGNDNGYHRAMQVKLPGDKDQAKMIKAASNPPIFKASAAKDPSPQGKKKTRVIVKRKTNQSKDDETQKRVHQDMAAMYHESFDSFVDGILLKEDATGKGYPGDVSVADFGRKGPANDTFGGGGVQTKGRGPLVKLTKNQLMTAKKKAKASGQDNGKPGFGKASMHSRKHPQNPYAGSK